MLFTKLKLIMNKIHELSQITTVPDLNLFEVQPTQFSYDRFTVTELRPISTLNSNSLIEFSTNTSIDEYIKLRETFLKMQIRIDIKRKDSANVTADDWKKIQPVNNFLHSLFQSVDIEIEGKSITQNPQTYAYKAFMETWLGYTPDAKASVLSASGYYNDYGKKTTISSKVSDWIKPTTVDSSGRGKSFDLMGKLHLDLIMQPKPLIGGTRIKFILNPNKPEFYLWNSTDDLNVSVVFEKAALQITRAKVNYPVVEAHNLAIAKGTAKYPITRGIVKGFNVPSGCLDVSIDNAITGQIPRRVFLALVSNKAFNGDLTKNPFNFEHFNLNYIAASIDGIQYPSLAFTPDFTNDLFIREYLSIFDTLNQITSDSNINLQRQEYKEGNVVYGFSFGADDLDDYYRTGYINPIKYGAVNFNLKFSTALTEPINVLVYCEFDNLIQIDATRQAITDYI